MAFQPGESGNPRGRPKAGETLTDALRWALRTQASREKLARKLVALANAGNIEAMKYVWDRFDGKLPTPINLSGDPTNREPIETVIIRRREDNRGGVHASGDGPGTDA